MLNLKHGGHVPSNGNGKLEGTPFDYLLPDLKKKPGAHIPGDPAKVTVDLKALGAAMVDSAPPIQNDPATEPNSNIPGIYTYWGQFIDHDMTANTDRDSSTSDIRKTPLVPVDPDKVTKNLRNLRRPTLDLDSVYGNGPDLGKGGLGDLLDALDDNFKPDPGGPDRGLYDGIRMRIGNNADGPGIPGVKIPPVEDLRRDLPRIGPLLAQGVITDADIPASLKGDVNLKTRAFVGDLRNDENLIVAQFHLAVLRFHNKVVDAIEANPKAFKLQGASAGKRFRVARRLVRHHYQWLVVHDFLQTVCLPGVVDKILVGGPRFYKPLKGGELFAPLEYSVAVYRFGHTMVRAAYDHNRNFGKAVPPNGNVAPFGSFANLFAFTGNGHIIDPVDITKSTPNPFRGQPTLPFNWIMEFDRFTRKADPDESHYARKIDTRLAPPLLNMANEGTAADIQDDPSRPMRQMLRSLAQRNLLRGYLLSIPTGQAVADKMGVAKLTADELTRGNSPEVNTALTNGGFVANTPLWFYILKEAEVRANGNSLGELGSRIVAETQIGIMRHDPKSYLNVPGGWDPSDGVKLPDGDPIVTIRDFLTFAGVTN